MLNRIRLARSRPAFFILLLLAAGLIFDSCSPIKRSKRKLRKVEKLLTQAKAEAPQLFDTLWVIKRDTIILNKDSIVTRINLVLDTAKVDSLVEKLIQLKKEGGDTRAVRHEIFKEIIPDMSYSNVDSLKVVINETTHYIRFKIDVKLDDDQLQIITKPTSNVPIVTSTAVVTIDARKMGRFWKGVQWGAIGTLLLFVVLWFLRGVISTGIKAMMP